jgi:1,4-alpha-glucan branching enzyme
VISNFTPVVHHDYRIGVPAAETYCEVFNSDDYGYGGSDQNNRRELTVEEIGWHNQSHSMRLTLPPLATIFLKPVGVKHSEMQKKSEKIPRIPRGLLRRKKCRRQANPLLRGIRRK